SGTPEIWIFLKKVDPDQERDPGDQLRRVLVFKERLIKERELLFSEFDSTEAWRKIFYESLLKYVLALNVSTLASGGQTHASAPGIEDQQSTPTSQAAVPFPVQVRDTLAELATFSDGPIEQFEAGVESLDLAEIARLYLLAATLISRFGTR